MRLNQSNPFIYERPKELVAQSGERANPDVVYWFCYITQYTPNLKNIDNVKSFIRQTYRYQVIAELYNGVGRLRTIEAD